MLPAEQTLAVLDDYRRRHPRAARWFVRTSGVAELRTADPLPASVADRLPAIRIMMDTG
ncbi:MAG TPA: hypothetical protein VLJ59_07610 [Mycobacteriales bacterium]|nr:hypothetical protein [Mycobacteriales bacterium]